MPSSIHSLPPELLLTIFKFTMPSIKDSFEVPDDSDTVSPTWPDIFDLKHGPWVLGQVCSRWRSIALSIPQLWSTFYVGLPRRRDSAVDVLQAWLGRSGNRPLQFQITATLGFCGHHSGSALLTTLADASSRWQAVELVDVSMKFLDTLAMQREIQLSSFPVLKELSLRSRDWDIEEDSLESEDPATAYEVFLRAPNLVTLINLDTLSLSTFKFPWNQLTTYIGSDASHAIDHLEIMLLCPNLVECDVAFGRTHTWPTVPLLALTQLRKWTIRIRNSSHDIYSLLSQTIIEVPNLQELTLLARPFSLTPILDLFHPVLISSSCSLQYLELSGSTVGDSLLHFLEAVATITRLRIWMNSLTILPLLQSQETLIPMLDTLDIGLTERADLYAFDITLLAVVVRSRRRSDHVQNVRRLNIVLDELELDVMGPHVFPPIMEVLQEEGLDIHICKRNEKLLHVK
ncbi:hypothetical protein J3R30DRAFT_1782223 [Lentinula aciculospora]|uniref:F-box domain-containing protein n=1 Tax=Lentinula aciculospora TaxID=153920 RepID=A0A9W9DRV6_9AGAR|nr:hypothetical protein J3R30DRAFT_1782223 [Lentinula aciculospora]